MSAAAAPTADAPKPKRKLPKKLLLILAVVGVLVAGGAAATVFVLKQKAAAAAELYGEDGAAAGDAAAQLEQESHDPGSPPSFLPLEPFVVNLADREEERYAQIGVTLQVGDAAAAEQLKAYMPAIRNGVLLILADKTSADLLDRAGKEKLAAEIMRESVRPLGIRLPEAGASAPKSRTPVDSPVKGVHFSSFIIQ